MRMMLLITALSAALVGCSWGGDDDERDSGDGSGQAGGAPRSLPEDCPSAEDVSASLGQPVELDDRAVGGDPDADLKCGYFFGPLSGDGSGTMRAWRLPAEGSSELDVDYLIDSNAPRSVFGEPEPYDMGDDSLVSRFDDAIGEGLYAHDAFAIVPAGDRACLGGYASVVSAAEPRADLEDTFRYVLGSMCGL